VTPESLVEKRLLKNTKIDVKLLGTGEVSKKLTIRVHAISASAREKIEAAGGTIDLLREPKAPKRKKHHKEKPAPAPAAAEAEETPAGDSSAGEPPTDETATDQGSTDQGSTDQGSETPEA
jgi:large subunit ribosomal protein L15